MIRSMTGFGEAEAATAAGRLTVELRTVNHRYLNVNARMPSLLARWEPEVREWLRGHFTRGHVNCTVRLDRDVEGAAAVGYRLDTERVSAYLSLFEQLGREFGVTGTPDLGLLTRFSDVIIRDEADEDAPELMADDLREVLEAAARQNVQMRDEEGKRLQADLEGRLAAISAALDAIAEAAPARLVSERDRLRAAVAELTDGLAVDEARIAQEIALLAERWDINEEIVRYRSHIELFREALGAAGEEPVGKRLGFLVQEMHREANTIGSKANDARIAQASVGLKEEIERVREQVENVE